MIASDLYKRTLSGYCACLNRGELISLSKYCKAHRVNSRGLRYWMKKHSINLPKPSKSSSVDASLRSQPMLHPFTEGQQLVPLLMQSGDQGITGLTEHSLAEVNITLANGIFFCIKEISPADLTALILSCNTR